LPRLKIKKLTFRVGFFIEICQNTSHLCWGDE